MIKKDKRTCLNGHTYYKSSDCSTCPVCEAEEKKTFFVKVAAPVRRALQDKHIYNAKDLANYSEKEILSLHGIGKTSLPILRKVLKEKQLKFKSDE